MASNNGKQSARPRSKADVKASRAEVVAEFQRQQARAKRRGRLVTASMVVVAVLIVAGAVVFVSLHKKAGPTVASGVASSSITSSLAGVPASTFDAVGAGTATAFPATVSNVPPLTADGLPRVLYVGAEYCPYCAAERWPMTVALSRFGTFSNLGTTSSSATDVDPSTPTLSFHGATYKSSYLSFTGIEETTNISDGNGGYTPLDTPSTADQALLTKYDYPPYVSGGGGSIPFIDFGGKAIASGASYDPKLLAGLSQEEIAGDLADPDTAIAKAIDGSANGITAVLCTMTDNKPADVCTSAGVTAAAAKLTS